MGSELCIRDRHEALIKKVANTAKGGEYRIYPSRTQDPKKNPLDPSTKVKFMHKAYPDHANSIVANDDMRTIFDVLTALDDEGYSSVNIVVGGDRVSEFNSLATKYNGKAYNFDDIQVTSAGDRDPDGEGVEGMSASKLRKAINSLQVAASMDEHVTREIAVSYTHLTLPTKMIV